MKLLVLLMVVAANTTPVHHPEFVKPDKLKIQCVDPQDNLNYNLRMDPTSRRFKDRHGNEWLFQYQLCRSA